MSITRDFKLPLFAGRSVPLVINANQYDDGEIWRFTLLDENGQKYSPSTGSIIGLKSDGHIIANAGTVSSTGLVIIAETEQMTAAVGKNFYELLIDDDTHGTANFIVFVEPRPGADGTPSDSDLAVFQEAIDAAAYIGDVSDLVNDVDVLEARMDEFTTLTDGSTTGDAELADIRVGADGTTYPNAGDAVRGQVSDLKNALNNMTDIGEILYLSGNPGGGVGETISISSSPNYDYTVIDVNEGDTYECTYICRSSKTIYVHFTDEEGKILSVGGSVSKSNGQKNTEQLLAPVNAKRMYVASYIYQGNPYIQINEYTSLVKESAIIKQATTETDNIFYYTAPRDTKTNNYTITFEKDGSMTINGTLSSIIRFPILGAQNYNDNNINSGDIISCNRFTSGVGSTVSIRIYSSDNGISTSENVSFEQDDAIYVRASAGTYNNFNVKFIVVRGAVRPSIYYPKYTAVDYVNRGDLGILGNSVESLKSNLNSLMFSVGLKNKNKMLFSAHRGAEGQAPYGSYPSYELACQQGWDIIQIASARQSADGTWYCLHDDTVDAQTNGTGYIAELTDVYINSIYQDTGVNVEEYTHEQMKLPTLESVLQLAYKYGTRISIRMGSLPIDLTVEDNINAWNSFISLVSNFSPENMMFSGTLAQVRALKQMTNNWHGNVYINTDSFRDVVDALVSYGYTNASIMASEIFITNDLIKYAHSKGYYCMSSQMSEPTVAKYIELSNWGLDIAQTGISDIHSIVE